MVCAPNAPSTKIAIRAREAANPLNGISTNMSDDRAETHTEASKKIAMMPSLRRGVMWSVQIYRTQHRCST